MSDSHDVVIIGGAVMGAACAYWLTRMQPGLRVLVAERDISFAQASTALSVDWKGEAAPAVATGDGVKEPLNRRSTIGINF